MEMMNLGDAFLKDYKDRHSTYFSDRPEERSSETPSIEVNLGDPMVTASMRASEDAREGMDTSSTRNLNSVVPPGSDASDTGTIPPRQTGPGGLTREEFEALSEDEKFRTVLKDAMPKPQGFNRVVAGVADFLTGDRYDYDQRGKGGSPVGGLAGAALGAAGGGIPLYGRETVRGPEGEETERSFGLFS